MSMNPKVSYAIFTLITLLSTVIKGLNRSQGDDQQIIFMAGPHKTASSSIQANLARWSKQGLLGSWRWGIQDTECFLSLNLTRYPKSFWDVKGFAPLMCTLAGRGNHYPQNEEKQVALIKCFTEQLENLWRDGYNIVLGSEEVDLSLHSQVDPTTFVRGLVDVMPKVDMNETSIMDRMTFVITYRYPRVHHFVSLWHQFRGNYSLREWILHNDIGLRLIHSLALAKVFVDLGFHVIILDSSGVQHEKVDISNAVACDILKITCMNTKIVGNNQLTLVKNVRGDKDKNDLSSQELLSIDEALQKLDCNYRDLLFHTNVTIKYGFKLVQSMLNCSIDHEFVSSSSVVREITKIVRGPK